MRKIFRTVRATGPWSSPLNELVEAPSLETFKSGLYKALENIKMHCREQSCVVRGWTRWLNASFPFLISMILWLINCISYKRSKIWWELKKKSPHCGKAARLSIDIFLKTWEKSTSFLRVVIIILKVILFTFSLGYSCCMWPSAG